MAGKNGTLIIRENIPSNKQRLEPNDREWLSKNPSCPSCELLVAIRLIAAGDRRSGLMGLEASYVLHSGCCRRSSAAQLWHTCLAMLKVLGSNPGIPG